MDGCAACAMCLREDEHPIGHDRRSKICDELFTIFIINEDQKQFAFMWPGHQYTFMALAYKHVKIQTEGNLNVASKNSPLHWWYRVLTGLVSRNS